MEDHGFFFGNSTIKIGHVRYVTKGYVAVRSCQPRIIQGKHPTKKPGGRSSKPHLRCASKAGLARPSKALPPWRRSGSAGAGTGGTEMNQEQFTIDFKTHYDVAAK